MQPATPDRELLSQLNTIPEVVLSGFTAREGLTGAGVTLLKGHTYVGNWRLTAGDLVWTAANLSEPSYVAPDVDDAVRQTLLVILRNLETVRQRQTPQARAG